MSHDQGISRKQPSWEVVHDGPSLPMIQSPSGRIFRIQELGAGGKQWDNPLDDETLCAMFAEALRSADTPNPLGLNEDSAQYSGQSIQSADVLIENAGGVASWLIINGEKTYIAPGENYRMPGSMPSASAPSADVMRENEELKRIRDLCVKSLVKATGRNEESIRDAPYTCASKHAAEVAALRSASVDTKRMDFMERFIVEGTCPEGGKIAWLADVDCLREMIDEAMRVASDSGSAKLRSARGTNALEHEVVAAALLAMDPSRPEAEVRKDYIRLREAATKLRNKLAAADRYTDKG